MADINREDVAGLIQDGYARLFSDTAAQTSVALAAFRTVPMGTKEYKVPVLATLPEAQWIDEVTPKPTDQLTWGNKNIVAEEVAVIIPVHENVVADATEDILGEIAARGAEAIAKKLDAAVLFGYQKPSGWVSPALAPAALAVGNTIQVSTEANDLAGSLLQAAALVAEDGYDPTLALSPAGMKFRLANLRDGNNNPYLAPGLNGTRDSVIGLDAMWVKGSNGTTPVWDSTAAEALIVDPDKVVIGVRQDITVKFLDQATVGGINLAERDMVALRFVARYGYALGDNSHRLGNGTDVPATKTPVASVLPAAA